MNLHRVIDGPPGAPPLLLCNSLGTDTDMWRPQMPALARDFRVIRYDHRGQGRSPASGEPYEIADLGWDALGLLDELDVPRAHVCGVSLGGMVAIWLAANAPERVDRLVLCSTSPHMPPASQWTDRAAKVRAARSTAGIADETIERWLTAGFRARETQTTRWLRAMVAASPPGGYAACCEAIGRMDQRDSVRAIRAPTLVMVGDEDPSTPPEDAKRIAESIHGARLEILATARHLASVEQPALFTRLTVEHLNRST